MYGKGKKPRLMHEHKGYHGSSKETHRSSAGDYAGTNELCVGGGPGKAAMRVKPEMGGMQFEKTSKSSSSKGMKIYSEE